MVWSVALSYFQGMLCGGYLLTHFLFGACVTPIRNLLYLSVLAISAVFTHLGFLEFHSGPETINFIFDELGFLFSATGIPILLLSTSSLVLQRWWTTSSKSPEEEPYFLFSASNLGSLIGIIIFPLVIEPIIDLSRFWELWKLGFYIWAGLILLAVPFRFKPNEISFEKEATGESPSYFGWFLPAMAGTALLSSITNVLTMDVASVPMIWVLPLAIFLWTYVRAFQKPTPDFSWYGEKFTLFIGLGLALTMINQLDFVLDAWIKVMLFLIVSYCLWIAANFVLMSRRPDNTKFLTRYYMAITLGGCCGSFFVAFLAPNMFKGLSELPLSLFLVAWAVWDEKIIQMIKADTYLPIRLMGIIVTVFLLPACANQAMPYSGAFLVSAVAGAIVYGYTVLKEADRICMNKTVTVGFIAFSLIMLDHFGASGIMRESFRNYYGIYRIFDRDNIRFLKMGSTFHGHEMLEGEEKGKPLFYYHPETPIGKFLSRSPAVWNKIAIVGLGAGTLAAYAGPGQILDFYELDPDNIAIAKKWFSYLSGSKAQVKIITGDGRLSLRKAASIDSCKMKAGFQVGRIRCRRRNPPNLMSLAGLNNLYDIIIIDAFSSDAIPVHLLTIEAVREYLRVVKPDGLLLFHVSNRHLNIAPVLFAAARELQIEARYSQNISPENPLVYPTRWVAIGSLSGINRCLNGLDAWFPPASTAVKVSPWTDRHSSLLAAFPPDRELSE